MFPQNGAIHGKNTRFRVQQVNSVYDGKCLLMAVDTNGSVCGINETGNDEVFPCVYDAIDVWRNQAMHARINHS